MCILIGEINWPDSANIIDFQFEDVEAKMETLVKEHKELTKRLELQNLEEARLSEMIREKADFSPSAAMNAER